MEPEQQIKPEAFIKPLIADLDTSFGIQIRSKCEFPYLTANEHRFTMGYWVPGDYRFRGYVDHTSGENTIFDVENWVQFHDELRTIGKDFEVHTSAQGLKRSPHGLSSHLDVTHYRIGYSDHSNRVESLSNFDVHCDILIQTVDWEKIEALHRVAVDSFSEQRTLKEVTKDLLKAARVWKNLPAEIGPIWSTMKDAVDSGK